MAEGGEIPDPREDREVWAPTPEELAQAGRFVPTDLRVFRRYVPQRPPWRLRHTEDEVVHVVPNGDLIDHELSDECACGPSSRISDLHTECDHPDVWIHQHHALDGRVEPVVK